MPKREADKYHLHKKVILTAMCMREAACYLPLGNVDKGGETKLMVQEKKKVLWSRN